MVTQLGPPLGRRPRVSPPKGSLGAGGRVYRSSWICARTTQSIAAFSLEERAASTKRLNNGAWVRSESDGLSLIGRGPL